MLTHRIEYTIGWSHSGNETVVCRESGIEAVVSVLDRLVDGETKEQRLTPNEARQLADEHAEIVQALTRVADEVEDWNTP